MRDFHLLVDRPLAGRATFKMKGTKRARPVVTADGDGVVSHAGSYLLIELADRVGLTAALSR